MAETLSMDMFVFLSVIGLRLFVPLLIPRYPLPALLACLVIDGVDQTIFQAFTDLPLDGYQGYDKALDIYYLTVAYISTMRNWSNLFAFQVSRFLFFWRLVGVAAFELLQWRPLLLIFPNTFEYFFIFYEAYRLRWDPQRMSKRFVIGAAAFIWIFIKLPQEWWLHIAQMDATDFIKETIFNMSTDSPWSEVIGQNLLVWILVVVAIVALIAATWWVITRKLPPADRKVSFDADAHKPGYGAEQLQSAVESQINRVVSWDLVEKIVMIGLVTIIFAQVLPNVRMDNFQVIVAVAFVILLNTVVSHWLARRGVGWESAAREFFAMAAVNFGLVLLYDFLAPRVQGDLNLGNTLFFVFLLTVLVVLYDRYRPVHVARFADTG
jgi:hypothetical protein